MKTDDPKLTAYALGEIPPAERAELEALLKDDPALAAELEATWDIAARLRTELQAEGAVSLGDEQRSEVFATALSRKSVAEPKVTAFPRRAAVLSAIAACLIVGLSVAILFPAMQAEKAAVKRSMAFSEKDLTALPTVVLEALPPPMPGEPNLASSSTPSFYMAAIPQAQEGISDNSALAFAGGIDAVNASAQGTRDEEVQKRAQVSVVTANQPVAPAAPMVGTTMTREIASKVAGFTQGWAKGGTGRMARSDGLDPSGGLEVRRRFAPEEGLPGVIAKREGNTESYDAITDNAFLPVKDSPLSTLSIDVDTASYANVRRFLTAGSLPPKGAVRIEEMLNYFSYDYPQPSGDAPFSATMEVAACPWTPEHRLVRIGLKGRDLARSERPAANLVFLIDVSGSMQPANKLPLVKESLRLLVDQLDDRDKVAIAVYAGASGTVLEPTRDKAAMRAALDRLQAGGSTNGAGGIQLAYELAAKSFIKGGTNRVILATDGDFNVGITSQSDLVDLIEKKAKGGVFLSVLGYGMGNLKDSTLEKLADKGNGNYGYIDTLAEAKKTLVEQMNGTLHTIAKDVKIQVEFNPAHATAYRLIGYENRLLAKEDFNDDKKDAGEIGAGHSVTALYEIVPAGGAVPGVAPAVDELKYTSKAASASAPVKSQIFNPQSPISNLPASPELLTLKLRYKKPDGEVSAKLEFPLTDRGETWEKSSADFRWAAAVASFGMLLRDSPHKGRSTWDSTLELAHEGRGEDRTGYRAECVALIEKARTMAR